MKNAYRTAGDFPILRCHIPEGKQTLNEMVFKKGKSVMTFPRLQDGVFIDLAHPELGEGIPCFTIKIQESGEILRGALW